MKGLVSTFAALCMLFHASAASSQDPAPLAGPQDVHGVDAADPEDERAAGVEFPENDIPYIVVTARGFGTRVARRNNIQIVDSIGPTDIGSLPSSNLVEVLKRLPGIQVLYDQGEAAQPLLRGLGHVQTLLDGREVSSAGSRFFNLGDIPVDVVKAVDVYKTQSANQVDGGMAGTIDIRTKRPFDYDGLHGTASFTGSYDINDERWGPNGTLSLGNSWDSGIGRVGVSLAAAIDRLNISSDFVISDSYLPNSNLFDRDGDGTFPGDPDDTVIAPGIAIPVDARLTHGRESGILQFQWAPSSSLEFNASILQTDFKDEQEQYSMVMLTPGVNSVANSQSFALIPEFSGSLNVIESGTFQNAIVAPGTTYVDLRRRVRQGAASVVWQSDKVKIFAEGDVTTGRSILDVGLLNLGARIAPTYELRLHGFPGNNAITVTGLDVTDPANFTLGILGDIYTHHTSDGESGRIDFEYYPELTYLQTLQFGARYSERTSDQIGATEILPLPPDPLSEFPELAMVSPASGFAIAAALPMSDMQKLRSSFGLAPGPADPSPSQEYSLTEKTYAGYGRIIYEFGLGDIEVDGDLGVRVVETKTDAEGAAVIAGGDTVATLKESSYTDVLPSASIRFRLSPEFTLRASASKTVTRPDFLSLSPTLNLSSTTGTGSGGNPDLKAFTTSGADLALEWYFSNSGYATAGIFYKDVEGFLQNESRIEEIGGTPYVITRPVQGSEGHVKGVELQYSHRFIDLPGLLSNLGLNANYTYIDSAQPVEGTEETIQIVGLSKDTVNLGVYYASDPLFVRFGYNYRSGFLQNVANLDAIPGQNEYGSQTFMDATVQYTFTPKVAVVANVLNIAQPTTGYFKMDPLIPSNRFKTYRRYEVGVRLTF